MIDTGSPYCDRDHEVGVYCDVCDVENVYSYDDEPATATCIAPDEMMRRCLEDVKSLRLLAGVVWPDAAMHLDSAAVALRDALDVVAEEAAW